MKSKPTRQTRCTLAIPFLLAATCFALAGEGPAEASKGFQQEDLITNSFGMKLRRIPAGEFLMGSSETDPGARDDEMPPHTVRITRPFYIGIHEVTQAEFEAVMGTNPSSFTRTGLLRDAPAELDCARLPVDNVTWFAALEFCRRLSNATAENLTGRIYRLPTEAEWEYACRAGTTTLFHYGNSLAANQANFNGQYPFGNAKPGAFLNRTAPVGSYEPNAFGLYDMHGNLNEWCLDKFDREYYRVSPPTDPRGPANGTSPVIRGGDWYSDARDCRSAFRYADIPEGSFYALGMRVVCELKSQGAQLHPLVAGSASTKPAARPEKKMSSVIGAAAPTRGEDWPRWRGPRSNGTWRAPQLPTKWPKDGLQQVWRQEIGGGYGGISVSGGRAYVMDRQTQPTEVERILCFDATTGKPLWSRIYPVDYSNVAYGNGPRSTPTVFRGHLYTLGAVGNLHCLDATTGKPIWSKDLVAEFAARVPIWGLSASPVVFEDLVIVHPGAEPDGCYIAFDRNSGKPRWRSVPDPAGYATPLLVNHAGKRQLLCWTPNHIRGLEPASGRVLWSIPFEVNYGTSIANPIFENGIALVSSYYDGSKAIQLGADTSTAKLLWQDRRNLRALMSQPLYRNGKAFLLDKRHGLTCFELSSGTKLWDDDNRMTPKGRNPQASMVWLNDSNRAIALNSDGDLILLRLDEHRYLEQDRTNIIGRTWAHPAYSGNCVYARSDDEIVCVLFPNINRSRSRQQSGVRQTQSLRIPPIARSRSLSSEDQQ